MAKYKPLLFLICLFFFFLSLAGYCQASAEKKSVGMITLSSLNNERKRLDIGVWYPANASCATVEIEGWEMTVARSARIIPGFYPVVLLSHDVASSRFAHHDLATALAANDFIVIAPTHPCDSQDDSSLIFTAEALYQRPRNLLYALDVALGTPELGPYIDESRIGLVGVGFGAITVMQLLGKTPDLSVLKHHCSLAFSQDSFCSSWVYKRLMRMQKEMPSYFERYGTEAFSPALSFYAPRLQAVSVPDSLAALSSDEKKESWRTRFFGASKPKNSNPLEVIRNNDTRQNNDQKHTDPGRSREKTLSMLIPGISSVISGAEGSLNVDFQDAFDQYDETAFWLSLQLVGLSVAEAKREPPKASFKEMPFWGEGNSRADVQVYRRSESVRLIRSVVLVAPAGGMLFQQASRDLPQALAIIEAENNKLYPSCFHSQPFYLGLPFSPAVFRLEDADHFSLFAVCPSERKKLLPSQCGRLQGNSREMLSKKRDSFLIQFFFQTLEGVLSVPPPSGLIAEGNGR